MKVIVNAIPLLGPNTGIARYLRCLYTEMESLYGDSCEFNYFDGRTALRSMPVGPEDIEQWSGLADLFWKLPAPVAVGVRLAVQAKRQWAFNRIAPDYDIYHEAGFFPFKTPTSLKTVFTIHDASILRYPEHHPKERVLFMRMFLERRAHLADAILTVSQFSKSEISELLNLAPETINVTLLSHDATTFTPPGNDLRERLNKAGIPEEYFLCVGSGDPRKNVGIIPKAIEKAKIETPLVNAGWSGWASETESCVINLGYVTDEMLALLYQGAIALIYPSIYEGFGLPLAEAMACGCPVITTRKASLPEVAADAALYLNDPSSTDELANILLDLHNDMKKRTSLSKKALETAARFSWEQTAQSTQAVFRQTLGNEGAIE